MKLDILNSDGCGVCQNVLWDPEKIKDRLKATGIKRIINLVLSLFKSEETKKGPYCIKHEKLVTQTFKCMDYKPKKQIKMFGSLKDEEVKFDTGMIEGTENGRTGLRLW